MSSNLRINKNKKIIITGAGSEIGKKLINTLKKKNNILAISRSISFNHPNIKVLNQSIYSLDFDKIISKGDIIIHLFYDKKSNKNNKLSKKIINSSAKNKPKKIIYLSSSKVYEGCNEHLCHEKLNCKPVSKYAKEKYFFELLLKKKSINSIILRCPIIYGKNLKNNLHIIKLLIKFNVPFPLKSFHKKLSIISINKLSEIINYFIFLNIPGRQIFNISNKKTMNLCELINFIGRQLKKKTYIFYVPKIILLYASILFGFYERFNSLSNPKVLSTCKLKKIFK